MALNSNMVPLGTALPAFSLPALDGTTVSDADFSHSPLLVVFACNHCPYVRHLESAFGELLRRYPALDAVAICSNDVENYPDDAPEKLREQAERAGWTLPYLTDESQDVARAFNAACTPDFFLYDAQKRLAYRGAFDESTPGNGKPVTGELLEAAITAVSAGEPAPEPQLPAAGCGIKWKE